MRNKGNILLPVLVIGAIILIIFVAIQQQPKPFTTPTPTPIADVQTQKLSVQGKSDDVAAIEKDLKDTDLLQIDQELADIERELTSY